MPSHTRSERKKLSTKTAKVKRDAKSKGQKLTNKQAVGKAAGIRRRDGKRR